MFYRLGRSYTTVRTGLSLSLIVVSTLIGCGSGMRIVPPVFAVASATGSSSTNSSSTGSTGSTGSSGSQAGSPESSSGSSGGSTSPTGVSTQIASPGSTTNFGDSITCGYYATPNNGAGYMYSMEGYATLLDTALAAPRNYLCRGGDQAADMARLWVYPYAEPALGMNQLFTALIGVNDAHFCGLLNGCVTNWSLALQASLAWLALPATDKVTGAAMMAQTGSQTGIGASAWQTDLDFGAATTHNGATLSFHVQQAVAGRSLYLAYRVFDPGVQNGGAAVVSVDGVPATTLSATVNTGHVISTQNNTSDTIFLASVPLGAAGAHTVSVMTTSAEGCFFSVMWAGVSSANYATVDGAPKVVVGTITLTGNDTLNSIVSTYNAQIPAIVSALVADGMNIVIAPTGSALQPSDLVDLLHPGNAGHAKLAAAFESALNN